MTPIRVSDVAVRDVLSVREDATLAEAGRLLRDADCGMLPVVDPDLRVVGILTDRDVALALAAEDAPPSQMAVAEAMTRDVRTCRPDGEARAALRRMAERSVRRLPVCTADRRLVGLLSLDDPELLGALRRIARDYREKRDAREIEEHPTI